MNGTRQRYRHIPGNYQVLNAIDVDGTKFKYYH